MDETYERIESGGVNGNGNGAGPAGDTAPAAREHLGRLPAIIESLLLAAGAPVPLGQLVDALDGPGRAEVLAVLEALGAGYEREGRGLRLVHVAGGYQLRTPAEHGPWIRRLLRERPPRLSRPMLETLAIVAYRQPCTRMDVARTSDFDRRLVRVVGRKDAPGRPLLYATTREFLEVFGLPDLDALPTLRELGTGAELLTAPDLAVSADGVKPVPRNAAGGDG